MAIQRLLILLLLLLAACTAAPPEAPPAPSTIAPLTNTSAASPPPTEIPSPGPAEPDVPLRPTALPTPTPNPSLISSVDVRDVSAFPPLAWSPDGRALLLGGARQELIRYSLNGSAPVTLLDRSYIGFDYEQIRATWDHVSDAIITPRAAEDGSFAIVALSPEGVELRRFVEGVAASSRWVTMEPELLAEANAKPLSVFDVAIASDGSVGLLGTTDVLHMRLGQPDVRVALPPGVQAARNAATPNDYQSFWLAPQGKKLAVTVESHLYLFGPGTDDPLTIIELPYPQGEPRGKRPLLPLDLGWSPDGTKLAVLAADVNEGMGRFWFQSFVVDQKGSLRPLDSGLAQDMPPLPYITGNDQQVGGMAWSPDGRWLLLSRGYERQCGGGPNGCLSSQTVFDPEAPSLAMLWLAPGYRSAGVWSPDGRKIAVFCADTDAYTPDTYHLCLLTLAQG